MLAANDSELDSLMSTINMRYTKTELDAFFEGTSTRGKKRVDWDNVTGRPANFLPRDHTHAVSDLSGISGKSSEIDSDSISTLATSKAVKLVNDKTLNYVKASGFTTVSHVFGVAGETIKHIQIYYTAGRHFSPYKFVLSSSYPFLEASFMELISKVTLLVYDPKNATLGAQASFKIMLKIKSNSSDSGHGVPGSIRIYWEVISRT